MGVINRYKCKTCGKQWEIHEGSGMMHAELKNVITAFDENTQAKINTDVSGEQFPFFDFAYRAQVCKECGNLTGIPVLKTVNAGNVYVGKCGVCGAHADTEAEVICPVCGKDVECFSAGYWD